MSYRVKHIIYLLATLDSDEVLVEFSRLNEIKSTVLRQDLTKGLNQTLLIEKNTTDESLSMGDISTAKFVYIETDLELQIKLNGGSEIFKLSPTSGSKAKMLWEGEFTSIVVTNASTDTDAIVSYLVAG